MINPLLPGHRMSKPLATCFQPTFGLRNTGTYYIKMAENTGELEENVLRSRLFDRFANWITGLAVSGGAGMAGAIGLQSITAAGTALNAAAPFLPLATVLAWWLPASRRIALSLKEDGDIIRKAATLGKQETPKQA
ncbi:MAG: hypothetical protein KTR14_05755 [Vampirovibrio sp.]|nr:hypothetical protein [Vampirovibrio sp.]